MGEGLGQGLGQGLAEQQFAEAESSCGTHSPFRVITVISHVAI